MSEIFRFAEGKTSIVHAWKWSLPRKGIPIISLKLPMVTSKKVPYALKFRRSQVSPSRNNKKKVRDKYSKLNWSLQALTNQLRMLTKHNRPCNVHCNLTAEFLAKEKINWGTFWECYGLKNNTHFRWCSEFFAPFSAILSTAAPNGGHLSSKGREL